VIDSAAGDVPCAEAPPTALITARATADDYPIVSTLFANAVLNVRNGAGAGPLTTRPLVVNREPWQGQT
jgi:hypothetical protein